MVAAVAAVAAVAVPIVQSLSKTTKTNRSNCCYYFSDETSIGTTKSIFESICVVTFRLAPKTIYDGVCVCVSKYIPFCSLFISNFLSLSLGISIFCARSDWLRSSAYKTKLNKANNTRLCQRRRNGDAWEVCWVCTVAMFVALTLTSNVLIGNNYVLIYFNF